MLVNKPATYGSTMPRHPPNPIPHPPIDLQHEKVNHASKNGRTSKYGLTSTLGQNSTVGNDSALYFYPHLQQPTRMSVPYGGEESSTSSNRSPSTRMSLKQAATQSTARTVSFYRSGDVHMQAFKVAITRRHFRTFDSLLEALSDRIPLPFGVRTVSTPSGTHGISRLEEFEDGKSYVCSDKKTVKPLNLNATRNVRPPWFISKPRTRNKAVAQLVRKPDSETLRVPLRLTQVKTPKKIVIVRNGEPTFRHTILLSRRTPQSFESIMEDIGDIFRMRVHKMFTTDGRKIESLQALFLGPNVYVAAGREAFQSMEYRMKRAAAASDKKDPFAETELKERTPKELKKTKGKWRVSVVTSELPAAGTDSKVMITVYGTKGTSGPILLSEGNKGTFGSGNEDEFLINVGAIGELRKIRIAHDDSGSSPGWLCESITLTDVTTEDILEFPCNRWLSRDEDDGEICREIAAQLPDKPALPEITYVVSVTTGNLWNAGTDARVHLTMFGELGDCGPRMLQRGGKSLPQIKGTTNVYRLSAVTLGPLHRIVVGHDGAEPGAGWFLDKIVVKEDRVGSDSWVFECNHWLDAGEDDGKTVRELYAETENKVILPAASRSRSQADRNKEDLWWELEKWKFQRGNHIVLVNHATQKAVRVRHDAGIDGLGEPSHPHCAFEVLRRRGNIRVFSSVAQPSFHIALDQNRMLGQGKGGTFCEFHVKVFAERTVLLESNKYSGQHATFDPSGKAADTRGQPNIPGRVFTVYVKGCFRHNSIILLNTSVTQALAITSNGDVIGTGRRSVDETTSGNHASSESLFVQQFARFRVVKVAEGVRMFQCEKDARRFLRIKDGQCDGLGSGDVFCHFKVQKYKLDGYVTLQSMKHRGVFIGLNTNGKARPTVDTGDANTQFYVEVIKFGERRTRKADQWITPEPSFVADPLPTPVKQPITQRSTPEKPKTSSSQVKLQNREDSNTGPKDGDYRIYVTTGNSGIKEAVTLSVYGSKGQTEAIILGKGTEGGVFQCGQTDEFQANLIDLGDVTKIRIGVEESTPGCDWRLKQVKMKDMISNEILRFKFNRWLSRNRDDGATLRELPAPTQDENQALPVLRYVVLVRTSKESTSIKPSKPANGKTDRLPQVYLCLVGENGDTGRRLLQKKPGRSPSSGSRPASKPLFSPGQLDKFELEAVSLGELKECIISCPKSSQPETSAWMCNEIVVRETEGSSTEFVFRCNKWLGYRKAEAKAEISMSLVEKRNIKRRPSDSEEYEDGDWKISVTTGAQVDCGTTANVIMVACAEDGSDSGPVLLGNGSKGLFQPATTERFKVNLSKLKSLQKIRLSHDSSGSDPSWFIERVKLKLANSDVSYNLDVGKWLSLEKDPFQMAVEIPIPKPGEELLPVFRYKVLVYTGGLLGSDTEANVYVRICGDKGDSGKRSLHKSLTNDVKFQESQLDIFEIEAVHLGELTKIDIGHDGVGPGNGWFLHKVLIKESNTSPRDYIFFCNRWLDDGQDDGKIERTINVEPLDDSEPEETNYEGRYKVLMHTHQQSSVESCPPDTRVTMVIYGEEGKTSEILLRQTSDVDETEAAVPFRPGKTDEFEVEIPEIGRIYKIRVSLSDEKDWRGVYLEKITLENMRNKQRFEFPCSRWLSSLEDDQETIREFAVASEGEKQLPVHLYYVSVATGNRNAASTDANVFITLKGERGDTGKRPLAHSSADALPFQPSKTDSFVVEAVDLGRLEEVVICHDGTGYGAGWFLDQITVRESEFAGIEWVFPCHMWLDDHVGDCKTSRRLTVLGSYEVNGHTELEKLVSPASREGATADDESLYELYVLVDEVMTQGNESVLLLGCVQGDQGVSGSFSLGEWRPGALKEYQSQIKLDVGEISKLRVEMEDTDKDFNLFLMTVSLRNIHTKETLTFSFHRNFRTNTGSTTKELPALRSNKPYKQVMSYMVDVEMSPSDNNSGSEGRLCLNLAGDGGESGFRTLFRSMDGFKATKTKQGYSFQLEAVDLGHLTTATIAYVTSENNEPDADAGWIVGEVMVRASDAPNSFAGEQPQAEQAYKATVEHTFQSVPSVSRVEKEYVLTRLNESRELNRTFHLSSGKSSSKAVKSPSEPSKGVWKLSITTLRYDEASIFNRISAQIFATRDCSDLIDVSRDVTTSDETINIKDNEVEIRSRIIDLGTELGQIYLVRLIISQESNIRIYKIKLKDTTTGQEYMAHISAQQRLSSTPEDNGYVTFNLPLVRPDETPLKHHKYKVHTKTGDLLASDTDGDVKLNIVGTEGETGYRSLASLAENPVNLFQLGKTDDFAIETIDVGEPRKLLVALDGHGRGSGWFLDHVMIEETRDDVKRSFKFFLQRWLDDGVDDKLTEREMHVMATRELQPNIDRDESHGPWLCQLYTKPGLVQQLAFQARLTFCYEGMRQVYKEVVREISEEQENFEVDLDVEPEQSRVSGFGFFKLRCQIESSNDVIKNKWPIEEIIMVNKASNEKLRFLYDDILAWEGSFRSHVRELPVWRPNGSVFPVMQYCVVFHTSGESDQSFTPSMVTLELKGEGSTTGWRKIVTSQNSAGKFQPGRIDMFTIEAVDLGDVIDVVCINLSAPPEHAWHLDRVTIKRGFYADHEQVFNCAREVKENEVMELTQSETTLSFPVKPSNSSQASNLSSSPETTFNVDLWWSGLSSGSEHSSPLFLQLNGSKNCSEMIPIGLEKAELVAEATYKSSLQVPVNSSQLGELVKVGFGVLEPDASNSPPIVLNKISLRNQKTDEYYSFRPKHEFFVKSVSIDGEHQTGQNWIELVTTLPRQNPVTVPKKRSFLITLRTGDQESAGTKSRVYITIVGDNGNSGKRWLLEAMDGSDVNLQPGSSVVCQISGVDAGQIKQVVIGHDGRDASTSWFLDSVQVTSSEDTTKKYIFVCQKWLSDLAEDTFIEKTLDLTRVEVEEDSENQR